MGNCDQMLLLRGRSAGSPAVTRAIISRGNCNKVSLLRGRAADSPAAHIRSVLRKGKATRSGIRIRSDLFHSKCTAHGTGCDKIARKLDFSFVVSRASDLHSIFPPGSGTAFLMRKLIIVSLWKRSTVN